MSDRAFCAGMEFDEELLLGCDDKDSTISTPRPYKLTLNTPLSDFRMTYQLIDIELPEVIAVIHSNDGQEQECSKSNGWLNQEQMDTIKQIVRNMHDAKVIGASNTTTTTTNNNNNIVMAYWSVFL